MKNIGVRSLTLTNDIMIYGANGYTGELITREATRRGLRPIIAGRSEGKLRALSSELSLEVRAFDVAKAADHLADIKVLLNCAGPFSATAAPLVDACLDTATHYIDITGEIDVFQYCHGRDERAREAGVILCPGTGFDIVPTDCLAASLKSRLPDAHTINLAFNLGTKPSIGTAKTAVEGLSRGGLIRRDHALRTVSNAYDIRRIPFPGGQRWAATIPWGDVFTSGISTGVPNGMVYVAMPLPVAVLMRLSGPFRSLMSSSFMQQRLNKIVERMFKGGPDEQARDKERAELWGEAINQAGKTVTLKFTSPNAYRLTVDAAVEIASHCLTDTERTGYMTASMLMGEDLITKLPDVSPMTSA